MYIVLLISVLICACAQAPGFWLYGVPNSNIGTTVGSITDLDGDGDADMFVGGPTTGETYLVLIDSFGGSSVNLTALSGLNESSFSITSGTGVILQGDGDTGNSISSAGDFNGDGIKDMIIGAPRASPFNVTFAGASYIVFGRDPTINPFPSVIDLRQLNGIDGFQIISNEFGEEAGTVGGIDDINNDGYDDIIIGAPLGSPNGENSGRVYVIYGFPGPFPEVFNLSMLNGSNGFILNGISAGEQAGYAVSRAGDVNADGFPDYLIAAPFANVLDQLNCGRVYLLYGNYTNSSSATIELSLLMDSPLGTIFNGGAGDYVGFGGVASIGDFNNDSTDDIILGAPHSGPSLAGQAFVVFGRRWDSPRPFNHSHFLHNMRGLSGFALVGTVVGGTAGYVGPAGDINGDFIPDLIVGAPLVSPQGIQKAGQTYVLFGKSDVDNPFPASIKLTAMAANQGFVINGGDANSQSGFSVSTVGDLDGDGFADILIGAPSVAPNPGEAFVIFGRNSTANPYRNPFNLNLLNACWGYPPEIGSNYLINQSCVLPVPAGKSCNLTCSAGYYAVGNLSSVCSSEGIGHFQPTSGYCQAALCPGLSQSLLTGVDLINSPSYCFDGSAPTRSECIFTCLDGYSRVGSSICTAQNYNVSSWVSNQTCIPSNCSAFTMPAGSNINSINRKCLTTEKQTGSNCSFTCNPGYIHNGGTTWCVGVGPGVSGWSSNQSCIPTNCSGITLPVGAVNADPICTNGQARTGDSCRFSCAPGYNLTGATTCVGVSVNTSAFSTTQTCIAAACPALPLPAMGVNVSSVTQKCLARTAFPGDCCNFTCLPGYVEAGMSICQGISSGVSGWTTNQTCVAVQCPPLDFPLGVDEHSTSTCVNATTGTICRYSCSPGFSHEGVSVCVGVDRTTSAWITNQTCNRAACDPITLPPGAVDAGVNCLDGSALTGDECTFDCENGYQHSGVTLCQPSGEKTSAFFSNQTCIPASCGAFRLPAGVDTSTVDPICTSGDAVTGDFCSFGCRAGYSHSGTTVCFGTGPAQSQFVSNQTCQSAFCDPIELPPGATHVRGHCTDGQAVIGDTCAYDCTAGYVHSGITVCASTGPLTAAFFNTQQCQDYDSCTPNVCGPNANCIDHPPPSMNHTCECEYGYALQNDDVDCEDIPACQYFPCPQNVENCGEILGGANGTSGRICDCMDGYNRSNITGLCEDIPACINFPCDTHATCTEQLGGPNSIAGRKCECIANYYGNGEFGYCFVIETCDDELQDNGETDIDCGGIRCSPCAIGQKCSSNSDCQSRSCEGTCKEGSPMGLTWLSQVLLILIISIVLGIIAFIIFRWMYNKGWRFPCIRRTVIDEMELAQIEGEIVGGLGSDQLGEAAAADPVLADIPPPANVEEIQFLNQANQLNQDNSVPEPEEPPQENETDAPESVAVLFHEGAVRIDNQREAEVEPGEPPASPRS